MSSTRVRLARALEDAAFAYGIGITVSPKDLHPASGWYRTSPQADCFRWWGTGVWQVPGSARSGLRISFDSWDTMTDCVRHGVVLTRRSGAGFEAHCKTL